MTECCPQPASPRTPEQQAAHEQNMERIQNALGSALTDAPRLSCGCLDYPVGPYGKTAGSVLDPLCYGTRWDRFKDWLRLVRTNLRVAFGLPPW